MNVFQCLLCNQYDEITKKGGDGRKAQASTLLLITAMLTLWVIIAIIMYDYIQAGFLRKNFVLSGLSGKSTGKLLAVVFGVIIFLCLKFTIGTKTWYDKTIDQFHFLSEEEQKKMSKKGIRFVIIGFIPVMIGIVWAFSTLF